MNEHEEAAKEIRLAERTLRRTAHQASGWDWLPAIEKTPEDTLVHGVMNEGDDDTLIVGGCSCDGEITDGDALHISLFGPGLAIPIADWLGDAADCIETGRSHGPEASRFLRRAHGLAKRINARYERILSTGIYVKGGV